MAEEKEPLYPKVPETDPKEFLRALLKISPEDAAKARGRASAKASKSSAEVAELVRLEAEHADLTRDEPVPPDAEGTRPNRPPAQEPPVKFSRWADVKARRKAADGHVYVVKAVPWTHGHQLFIVGEGVTQTHDEDGTSAEDMVRDWLHLMKEQPPESFNIRIDYVDSWDE